MVGQLGQGFGGGDADGDGNSGPALHAQPGFGREFRRVGGLGAGEPAEGLVNGILAHVLAQGFKRLDDPGREIAVEGEVGGKDGDTVLFQETVNSEFRLAHGYVQRFGLGRARDDAAVVVGEHDDGPVPEVGAEKPFAGSVEIIAVGQEPEAGGLS